MASRPNRVSLDPTVYPGGALPKPKRYAVPASLVKKRSSTATINMRQSDWVENFIRIEDGDTGTVKPVELSERRYLRRIYDTPARRVLLMTSRQTEKSTTLGNKLLTQSGMRSGYKSMFVSPSAMQTTVFSRTRLDDIIRISEPMQILTNKQLVMNILEKEFINRSKIYLRYAFLTADRIRGLSVNAIFADEIQDLLQDLMPVIEESASRFKDSLFVYSGTPKSLSNTIEYYWSRHSTQNEWAIPCENHYPWHWNVLGLKNLGKEGPICERCQKPIDPEHRDAGWVSLSPGAEYEGYRICRLMVPWFYKNPEKWKEILLAKKRYSKPKFMNEVMAISYDTGSKPLSTADLIRACDPDIRMEEELLKVYAQNYRLYMGIDWAMDTDNAYTVVTIGGYVRSDSSFQVVLSRRLDGDLAEPVARDAEIDRLAELGGIRMFGTDFGMGYDPNKRLTSKYGPARVHIYHYAPRLNAKIIYKPATHRYMVFRSPVMSDLFTAIKKMKVRYPRWEDYKVPYGDDHLSIISEYSESQRMAQFDKPRGQTDDTFHSVLYCLLASCVENPRPDIFAPIQEEFSAEAVAAEAMFDWNYEEPQMGHKGTAY